MSFTAGEVMRDARDRHPALHERQAPDITGRRYLEQAQRELMSRAVEADAHYAAARLAVPIADEAALIALQATGIPVPSHLRLLGATAQYSDPVEDTPVTLTTFANRLNRHVTRSAYDLDGTLYLMGDPLEWTGVTALDVVYSPLPTPVLTNATVLLVKDDARQALSAKLAAFWGARLPKGMLDPTELRELKEQALQAEASFVTLVRQPGRARTILVQGY